MNYEKIYVDLMFRATIRLSPNCPLEKHHAYPYHWFCDGSKKDFDWTIVSLTRREHFIAHRLLCKIFPECLPAKQSLFRMINTKTKKEKYKSSSRTYEMVKKDFCESVKKARLDSVLDDNRRKVTSQKIKDLWAKGHYSFISDIRKDPIKDEHRRKVCAEELKQRNENGLSVETRQRNKDLAHMSEDQIKNLREANLKALSGKTQVVFLDGTNGLVSKEYYQSNKNVTCFHASSKKAAELLGKEYKGGRPYQGGRKPRVKNPRT
jgi:hypothetical protein